MKFRFVNVNFLNFFLSPCSAYNINIKISTIFIILQPN